MSSEPARSSQHGAQPRVAARSLTHQLAAALTADIVEGRLPRGSRLPTEQELVLANGVSRTVVREAVAVLRADGLVVVRQGVGAFVAANVRRPFRIDIEGLQSLRQAIEVMELRTGIEVEAAGRDNGREELVHCFDASRRNVSIDRMKLTSNRRCQGHWV